MIFHGPLHNSIPNWDKTIIGEKTFLYKFVISPFQLDNYYVCLYIECFKVYKEYDGGNLVCLYKVK